MAAPKKRTAKTTERKAPAPRPPAFRPAATRPTNEAAARELRQFLDAYIRGLRGLVALRVEPLLRHYLDDSQPRFHRMRADLDRHLAGAAWQLVLQKQCDDALVRRFVEGVGRIRRQFSSDDQWPSANRGTAATIAKVLESKRMGEYSKANRIFEIFADGYLKRDTRRGIRAERRMLLADALPTAKMIVDGHADGEFHDIDTSNVT